MSAKADRARLSNVPRGKLKEIICVAGGTNYEYNSYGKIFEGIKKRKKADSRGVRQDDWCYQQVYI